MRLVRSDLSAPGIRRRKSGKGFRYFTPEGEPLRDPETLERVQDLVIPPAWRKVWISPRPNAHIQAVGVDDAGRKQYLYHEQWRRERDEQKHDRVLRLAKCLPKWREQVAADLHERGLTKTRVLGAALRMLDRGVFRTGSEEYAEANGTRGAATLLKADVSVRGDEIAFCYNAKGSIEREHSIVDGELAKVIKALLRAKSGSDRLLVYRDRAGWHEVHADQINERFKEIAGDEFTGKDLRTWHATVLAAAAFAAAGPVKSQRGLQRTQAAVMRHVAESLGNTPAVAKRSYVDPRVVHAYQEGATVENALRRLGDRGVRGDQERQVLERAVIRLLNKRSHV